MPAVALVGAVASVSAGLAAGGILGGMMIAGGVLTGLGTITKNPKLTKIGAILGLAGGIGSAISKAGAASSLGLKAAGEAGASASGVGTAASNLAEMGGAQGATMGMGSAQAAGNALTGNIGQSLAQFDGGLVGSQAGSLAQTAAPGMAADVASTTQALSSGAQGLQPPPVTPMGGKMIYDMAGKLRPDYSIVGQDSSTFGKIMGFMRDKQNAEILKLGGGLVQGAMASYDQQSLMRDKLRQEEAARGRYNQSILGQRMFNY